MTAPLRALIVEDEPPAVRRMTMALESLDTVEVVGAASDGIEGLLMIERLAPDLVFLDISLPGMSGLQLAERLTGADAPAVVFVTAYDKHAVKAFELAASDYLLKPVDFQRVAEAVDRVSHKLEAARDRELLRELRRQDVELPDERGELWVMTRRGLAKLSADTIEFVEAERDYVRVHAASGEYLTQGPMQAVLAKLDPERFIQVHRSYIVSWGQVSGVERRSPGSAELLLASGVRVPVGRTYLAKVRDLIASGRQVGTRRGS